MNSSREPAVVVVLGMHRSGTSLVSQIVQNFGVFGGRGDEQLQGDDWNSGGYYEVLDVLRMNRALLLDHGSNLSLPPLEFDHALTRGGSPERVEEARSLIDDFRERGDGVWVWKDPRFSLTLPWWKALLPRVVPILCLRHPAAVAESMRRRDDYEESRTIKLWEIYLRHALWVVRGLDGLSVEYEALVRDPDGQTARIGDFLAGAGLIEHEAVASKGLGSLMRRDLVHFSSEDNERLDDRQARLHTMALAGEVDEDWLRETTQECRAHRQDLLELTVQTLRRQLHIAREGTRFRARQAQESAVAAEKNRQHLEGRVQSVRDERDSLTRTLQETRDRLQMRESVIQELTDQGRVRERTAQEQRQRIEKLERRLQKLARQNLFERIVGKGRRRYRGASSESRE